MKSDKQEQRNKKIPEVKIFPVPFVLQKIKEKISITTHVSSKEQIIDQALKFHSEGNISEASKYYQQIIAQGCNDHRVFSNFSVILKGLGKLQEAELSQHKAIALNPNYAEAHSNLGNILRDLGRLKEAEFSLRKAIELNPKLAEAYYNLGNILRDFGRLKEAELALNKAIELKPDFADAHTNLSLIFFDLKKLLEAEISIKKAIELNPNSYQSHFILSKIFIDKNQAKQAEKSLRKAIKIKPDYYKAYLELEELLNELTNSKTSKKIQKEAISLNKSQRIQRLISNDSMLPKCWYTSIGFLYQFNTINHWVLSPPKAGTSLIFNSLRESGINCLHLHNDYNIRKYCQLSLPLKKYNISIIDLLKFRATANNNTLNIYFGVRDPISWTMSLQSELFPSSSEEEIKNIAHNINREEIRKHLPSETVQIINEYLGHSMLQKPFDKINGFSIFQYQNTKIYLYRLDSIDKIINYLVQCKGLNKSLNTRKNKRVNYQNALRNTKFDKDTVTKLLALPYVNHFFNEDQILEMKNKYLF